MAGILDVFDKVTVMNDFACILERCEILDFKLDIKNQSAIIHLTANELVPKPELYDFIEQTIKIYELKELDIKIKYKNMEFSDAYYQNMLVTLFKKSSISRAFLMGSTAVLEGDVLRISNVKCGKELLEANKCADIIKEIVDFELGLGVTVEIEAQQLDMETYISDRDERMQEINKKIAEKLPPKKEKVEEKSGEDSVCVGTVYGKAITEDIIPMLDVRAGMGICAVKGTVIDAEIREINKDGKLAFIAVKFDIGDDNWAITCELFGKADAIKKALPAIKENNVLSVRGTYEFNDRAHCEMMKVLSIELHEKPQPRRDTAEEKRVELHLHTKMSAKDAITSATDLINKAASWGHKAIAITDHGVAQAFPEANNAAGKIKKNGQDFKVIYGVEGYFVNDLPLNINSVPRSYIDNVYVVFDIETTGLDPQKEMITEIGAAKIVGGRIVDTFAQLINPGKPIPAEITNLTGISNDMVADKPTIAEIMPKFLEFCGDAIVVAHNAKFDTGFIRVHATRLEKEFKNKVEDTLELSRQLFPDEKSHKLNIVANRLGVSLENHHRAVDDATATAGIFIKRKEKKLLIRNTQLTQIRSF